MLNRLDEQGYVPLQWAALNNRTDVVNFLLGEGAQVNAVDHTGQTALHWAAVRGSLSAAETLLRSSADLRIRDCRGYGLSPLQCITDQQQLDMSYFGISSLARMPLGKCRQQCSWKVRYKRQKSLHVAS